MAEAVDRLLLVPDDERAVRRQEVDELELERVRVLELVDHDAREAVRVGGAQRRVVAQQIAGVELEVVEVQPGPRGLRVGEGGRVRGQQLPEPRRHPGRALVAARPSRAARPRRGTRCTPGPQSASILYVGNVRPASTASCAAATRAPGLAAASSACAAGIARRDGLRAPRRPARPAGSTAGPGPSRRRCAARRGPRRSPPPGGRPRTRPRRPPPRRRRRRSRSRSAPPRRRAQLARDRLVEHHERGSSPAATAWPRRTPRAEAVDRPDPGALGLARRLALAERQEARPHARAQLAGRLLGEGDRQDPPRRRPSSSTDRTKRSDEHRRLAAAGARREQQRALAPRDRPCLLLGERRPTALMPSPRGRSSGTSSRRRRRRSPGAAAGGPRAARDTASSTCATTPSTSSSIASASRRSRPHDVEAGIRVLQQRAARRAGRARRAAGTAPPTGCSSSSSRTAMRYSATCHLRSSTQCAPSVVRAALVVVDERLAAAGPDVDAVDPPRDRHVGRQAQRAEFVLRAAEGDLEAGRHVRAARVRGVLHVAQQIDLAAGGRARARGGGRSTARMRPASRSSASSTASRASGRRSGLQTGCRSHGRGGAARAPAPRGRLRRAAASRRRARARQAAACAPRATSPGSRRRPRCR